MFGLGRLKFLKHIRYSRTEKMTTIKKKQTPREARGKICFAAHISLRSADLGKTKKVSARSAGKKIRCLFSPNKKNSQTDTTKQKGGRRLRAKRQNKFVFCSLQVVAVRKMQNFRHWPGNPD